VYSDNMRAKLTVAKAVGETQEEAEANARYCAASREMFSALLECEVLLGEYPIVLRQVKATLAKAEGKS
jgi:hypothetical protein